jgi:hypothetical protein
LERSRKERLADGWRRVSLPCATAAAAMVSPFSLGATDPPAEAVETVTVEAQRERQRLERQLATFVSSLTYRAVDESVPRWDVPLCPLIAGLPAARGQFVLDRISQIASEAGMRLASEGCAPNLVVVVTAEPQELLRQWWRQDPRLFERESGIGGIRRTIASGAPVRVFYNSCTVPPGMPVSSSAADLPCGVGRLGSRLTPSATRVIYSVIAVADVRQIEGFSIGPLTDYIAMLSLAQVRRSADLGTAPTILRLFESDAARPERLSTWDAAFLKSLYASDSASATQISQIKSRMMRDLAR